LDCQYFTIIFVSSPLWHEAVNLPSSSAEVKNVCSCTSAPQYVFMVWYFVKHRDNCAYLTLLPPFIQNKKVFMQTNILLLAA